MHQIIIKNLEKPKDKDVFTDISWVCDSFGLAKGRDVNLVSIQILKDVLQRLSRQTSVTAEIIANDLDLNQAMINHHLRKIIETGIIYRHKKSIFIRGGSMKSAVDEVRKDVNRILDEIEVIAKEIDDSLGFRNR